MWSKARKAKPTSADGEPLAPTPAQLRNRALRLLAKREYSQKELSDKLIAAGGEAEAVGAVVADFIERGWVSDERFAQMRARSQGGRVAQRLLVAKLKAKGVEAGLAQETVAEHAPDDLDSARALWERRFGGAQAGGEEGSPELKRKARDRQLRFLLGRGFAPGVALQVVLGARSAEGD